MRFYLSRSIHFLMGNFISKKTSLNKLLTGKKDLYDGITIKSNEHNDVKRRQARSILQRSFENWMKTGVRGVWFEVDAKDAWWIPILLDNGFVFHHTTLEYVMLTKWLLSIPDSMPKFPFTFIGAGGLVVNSRGDVLLMKERRGLFLGWKFPGGVSNYGELIHETAIREVREETGVIAEFCTLLAFRQTNQFRYKMDSNIYFLCVLKPVNEEAELKPCPRETAVCKWMPRSELEALPESEFRWYYREVLRRYDSWHASGRRGCFYTDLVHESTEKNHDVANVSLVQNAIRKGVDSLSKKNSSEDAMNNENNESPTDESIAKGFYFFE